MIQLRIPVDIEKIIKITDEIYIFSEVMEQSDFCKYYSVFLKSTPGEIMQARAAAKCMKARNLQARFSKRMAILR